MKTTIQELLSAYREGSLAPASFIRSLRERILSSDNAGIWIHLLSEDELQPYLKRLENQSPSSLPLYGVPFAIKDNIDLAGVPTTAACPDYAYTPERSATVVRQLVEAGAIPMGKTNLDQFATGLVGTRSPYPIPRNPLYPERIPGGSSSGSAVALAEGMVAFSLGTDTAGSGRIPAAFNGLWGLKPSRGRLSTSGVVPACRTLDCVSIFAHSAEDCRTVLEVAESYDASDAWSRESGEAMSQQGVLAVPRAEDLHFFGDAHYEAAWDAALASLKEKGWQLREVDLSGFLETARLLYEGPWVSERYAAIEAFIEQKPDALYPVTRDIILTGRDHSAASCFKATYRLAELKRLTEPLWTAVDALVTPTAGGFPTLEEVAGDPIGVNSQLGYYTNFMNLLDLSAVACPAGSTEAGLPFGITWIAPRDHDRVLLSHADAGPTATDSEEDMLSVVLFGAHMEGLPLNSQVHALGARLIRTVQTAPHYRMVHLKEPAPERPGIIRTGAGGSSIEGELWDFPIKSVGSLLQAIQQPLGLGEIELDDGSRAHGFLCEAAAAEKAPDISAAGGWRAFLGE